MVRQNATNTYSNSRYIVDKTATSGCYLTIQSAITQAVADGGNASIWVRAGTYTENLTLYDTVDLEGADSALTILVGTHTPPNAGAISFVRMGLNSGTDILSSAAAGTTTITFSRCVFNLTNGYAANLTNWTGSIRFRYCIDNSTKNGIVYNTGGSAIYINHSILGLGANVMTANGNVLFFSINCSCPILVNGTGISQFIGGCNLTGNVSTANTHGLKIAQSRISTGAAQAITHNSATQLVLDNVIVGTSNATAIGGTGDIKMIMVAFPLSNVLAGTITQSLDGVTRTAEMWANNIIRMDDSGFYSWAAAAPFFDDATLGTFKLLVGGTGYIRNQRVTWVAQNITGMTAGNTYWIYIDSTGTIQKTAARTDALFIDNIVLFECLRDSTAVTNNQVTVKENHAYNFQATVSNYMHDVVGSVIENNANGANITLSGTQKIAIAGADKYEDHGLETDIPDSAGAGVTWIRMFTLVTGKWARQNATDTFTGFYNNGGTATALGVGKFGIYTLYVCKDTLNVTTPTYFAVLHTAQFNTIGAARAVIAAGTNAKATQELAALELCQLGTIIYDQGATAITEVTISKTTLRSTISTGGTTIASAVTTDISLFDAWLSAADTNVQSALNTLDEVGKNVAPQYSLLTAGAAYAIHPLAAVGTTGQLLVAATANYPAFASSAAADFTFTTATAGTTRTLNVTNTDNTGANYSAAALNLSVGGTTTTGDPYVHWGVTGGSDWSAGIDNSSADSWKLMLGANPSTGTIYMQANTTPVYGVQPWVEFPVPFVRVETASVGGHVSFYVKNQDATNVASHASAYIATVAGGGDPYLVVVSSLDWVQGEDHNTGEYKFGHGGPPSALVATYSTWTQAGGFTMGINTGANAANINTGSGGCTITAGNGPIALASGTGAVNIGTDATAKTVTVGNTTGASVLALKYGTGDMTLASATGTVISALDTGEVTMPLQSAFLAYQASDALDVTGDGTNYTLGTTVDLTEIYDQNADFDPTSGVFTSPITGKYLLGSNVLLGGVTTNAKWGTFYISTSNRSYFINVGDPGKYFDSDGKLSYTGKVMADMDAGDVATVLVQANNAGKVMDVLGAATAETIFYGNLIC